MDPAIKAGFPAAICKMVAILVRALDYPSLNMQQDAEVSNL